MRIFKKPTLTGKMPSNEDIYKDPKELAVLKAKVQPEEYLKALYDKIAEVEKDLTKWQDDFKLVKISYGVEFEQKKKEKEQLLAVLENTLETKRQQRDAAEIPIFEKLKVLDEREKQLIEKEKEVFADKQSALERERQASIKLEDVTILADQLGETRVRQMVKEKSLKELEKALHHNENKVLLDFEALAQQRNNISAELLVRESAVLLKEQNIESKQENLEKREEALINERLLIQSQRQALLAAQQHGNKRRT